MNHGYFCLFLQKEKREKEEKILSEFKRLCGIFLLFFPRNKSAGRQSGETTFHTAALAPRPRAKKGNVLLNVT